jgi:hypothetical protein
MHLTFSAEPFWTSRLQWLPFRAPGDVIAISIKCPAAREAQLSRMGQVEQIVAQAFAARMKRGRENEMSSRLLGGLTLTILDETMRLWFNGGTQDIAVVAEAGDAGVVQPCRRRGWLTESQILKFDFGLRMVCFPNCFSE